MRLHAKHMWLLLLLTGVHTLVTHAPMMHPFRSFIHTLSLPGWERGLARQHAGNLWSMADRGLMPVSSVLMQMSSQRAQGCSAMSCRDWCMAELVLPFTCLNSTLVTVGMSCTSWRQNSREGTTLPLSNTR
ncbi:hypothetical protein V8C86DRAFT_2763731 [Haematococcus lacustris]